MDSVTMRLRPVSSSCWANGLVSTLFWLYFLLLSASPPAFVDVTPPTTALVATSGTGAPLALPTAPTTPAAVTSPSGSIFDQDEGEAGAGELSPSGTTLHRKIDGLPFSFFPRILSKPDSTPFTSTSSDAETGTGKPFYFGAAC